MIETTKTTQDETYAQYLIQNQNSLKSAILQLPYRLHLLSLGLGRALDIGCGAGRNLKVLNAQSVGIDHNSLLVKSCNDRGLKAFITDEFLSKASEFLGHFESILISHVAEHMTHAAFTSLLKEYRKFLKPNGKIAVICPQEKGYASDSTHVHFMTFAEIESALTQAGFQTHSSYSFPFPRSAGKVFMHNEFVVIAKGV